MHYITKELITQNMLNVGNRGALKSYNNLKPCEVQQMTPDAGSSHAKNIFELFGSKTPAYKI